MLASRRIDARTPYAARWVGAEELAAHPVAWRALMARALEPNPFYAPDFLAASARNLHRADLRCLAVFDGDALCGLFPLRSVGWSEGVFVPAIELYHNDYIRSTAPLIDAGDPLGVWRAFFEAMGAKEDTPRVILSRFHPASRGTSATLRAAAAETGRALATIERFERAAVDSALAWPAYAKTLEAHRRSELNRQDKRLRALGDITLRTIKGGIEATAALEDFLRVERAGWKGASGTAMAVKVSPEAFVREACLGPEAEFDVLALNGRAIAVAINLNAGGALFTVKTAYDEAYKAFAPGLVLAAHQARGALAGERFSRLDSCADPDHPMGRLWLEREAVEWLAFASSPGIGAKRIDGLAATLGALRKLKRFAKSLAGRA